MSERLWGFTSLVMAFAALAGAQTPGFPFVAPRSTLDGLTSSASFDGAYHGQVQTRVPLALRATLDWARSRGGRPARSIGASLAIAHLGAPDADVASSAGYGAGVGVDLWTPGKRYFAFGGRLQAGVEYSRLTTSAGARREYDVPFAFTLVHELTPPRITGAPWLGPVVRARIRDDGGGNQVRWLVGAVAGTEVFRSVCAPGRKCLYGWGVRIAGEVARDFDTKTTERRLSLGLLWKFF